MSIKTTALHVLKARLAAWQASPEVPEGQSCSNPLGPSSPGTLTAGTSAPSGIIAALTTYFDAIDSGDYQSAYAQLGPDEQSRFSESSFTAGTATSYDFDVAIGAVTPGPAGSELVDVDFTSLQSASAGPNGDACDNWTLTYTMIPSGSTFLIDNTAPQGDTTHTSC